MNKKKSNCTIFIFIGKYVASIIGLANPALIPVRVMMKEMHWKEIGIPNICIRRNVPNWLRRRKKEKMVNVMRINHVDTGVDIVE